jgi:hypothetical protein
VMAKMAAKHAEASRVFVTLRACPGGEPVHVV